MAELALLFSILSPFLLAGTAFLFRNFLGTWVKARAEHGFNEKIERLRGEISQSEARLIADLQAKQHELDSLRITALSPVTSRRIALDSRRLQAAEQLWNYVQDLGSLKFASSMMSVVKFDALSKATSTNPKMREVFGAMFKNIDMNNLPGKDAGKLRPFVSPAMWAYYSALAAILLMASAKWKMLEMGVDEPAKYMSTEGVDKIIVAALPHHADYIKKYGAMRHHHLIDELEERLLTELHIMLEGKSSDADTVAIAANVMREVSSLEKETQDAASKFAK